MTIRVHHPPHRQRTVRVTRGARVVADQREHREQRVPHGTACVHRGAVLRTEPCRKCRGTVQVKVHACALVGECTLSDKLPTVVRCYTCQRREPPPGSLP